jgi:CubicO group peptidase (beta-lactamase class C family)
MSQIPIALPVLPGQPAEVPWPRDDWPSGPPSSGVDAAAVADVLDMLLQAGKQDAAAYAESRDFARFGLLYLRDGVFEGRRLLPEGWVDHARTPTPPSDGQYGAHWWLTLHDPGIFSAAGFNGQYVAVVPERDLVLARLGVSRIRSSAFRCCTACGGWWRRFRSSPEGYASGARRLSASRGS